MSDLEEFVRQYAKPYDPATDTYRRPPFARPVKAGKNSPIYNFHSYHTKVPPEAELVVDVEGSLILCWLHQTGFVSIARSNEGVSCRAKELISLSILRKAETMPLLKAGNRDGPRTQPKSRGRFAFRADCDPQ
mgnify:CR=1 FL=1